MKQLKKLYFSVCFSNPINVPASLKWVKPENDVRFKGIENPGLVGERINLENILFELEQEGLFIQNGSAQKRVSEKKMFFTAVKFEFGAERINSIQEELLKKSFLDIFSKAFWNIKIFSHDGDVTVACAGRTSRFEGNDKLRPVKIWKKDAAGERVGNEPLPIQPEGVLLFLEGSLQLGKYE